MLLPLFASVLVFASPDPPRRLMTDEAVFEPFGRAVAAEVARELAGAREGNDSRRLDLPTLLAIEVHWAIHSGDSKTALQAAEQIRARLVQPERKAFAGVTTEALVAADEAAHHNRTSAVYVRRFRQEFAQRLAALPKSPAMHGVVVEQRGAIAAQTPENLIAEVEKHLPPGSHRGGYTLEQANEIIRARHKLADLAPLRSAMLEELDRAIRN